MIILIITKKNSLNQNVSDESLKKKTLEKTRKIQKYSYIFTRKTSKKQCRNAG